MLNDKQKREVLIGWIPNLSSPYKATELTGYNLEKSLSKAGYKKILINGAVIWEKTKIIRDSETYQRRKACSLFYVKIKDNKIDSIGVNSDPFTNKSYNYSCNLEFNYDIGLIKIHRHSALEEREVELCFAQLRDIFHIHLYHKEEADFLLEPCWTDSYEEAANHIVKQYEWKVRNYMDKIKNAVDSVNRTLITELYNEFQDNLCTARGEIHYGISFVNTLEKENCLDDKEHTYLIRIFENAKNSFCIFRESIEAKYEEFRRIIPINFIVAGFYLFFFLQELADPNSLLRLNIKIQNLSSKFSWINTIFLFHPTLKIINIVRVSIYISLLFTFLIFVQNGKFLSIRIYYHIKYFLDHLIISYSINSLRKKFASFILKVEEIVYTTTDKTKEKLQRMTEKFKQYKGRIRSFCHKIKSFFLNTKTKLVRFFFRKTPP